MDENAILQNRIFFSFCIGFVFYFLGEFLYMLVDEIRWRFSLDDFLQRLHVRRKAAEEFNQSRSLSVPECIGKDFLLEYKDVLERLLNGDVELSATEKECFALELKETVAELAQYS